MIADIVPIISPDVSEILYEVILVIIFHFTQQIPVADFKESEDWL